VQFSYIILQPRLSLPNPPPPALYLSSHISKMGKSKSASKNRKSSLPEAPWLYINDATSDDKFGDDVLANLVALIPKAVISCPGPAERNYSRCDTYWESVAPDDAILIFAHRQLNASDAVETANDCREKAIELGKNFASVNLTKDSSVAEHGSTVDWGTNHLALSTAHLAVPQAAEKIFKWLCKLSPP
jgi:hypothetical protein